MPKPIKFRGRTVTHTGLIGMLEGNEIDIGLTDLSLTYGRSQVLFLIACLNLKTINTHWK